MAAVQFENFFFTELSTAVAPGDTTIQITQDGLLGTLLTGGNWIYLNLVDATSWNNNAIPPATYEIVKATAITGTGPFTLTVTRGQDHTSAQSFSRCDICAFLLNAQSLYDISTTPGSGTVTQINTTLPITGGPITTTGTIGINTFGASGGAHARGAVPDPGGSAGTTKFLREDATWAVPAGGGGAVTSVSTTDPALTISPTTGAVIVSANNMVGDSGSGGTHGVVPAPAAGDAAAGKFLKANGTWAVPSGGGGGGVLQGQEFTSSGTFNVPTGVTSVWLTMIGGGGAGGGSTAAATGGGGGGSGELVQFMPVLVTSSSAVTVTVPAAATGSSGSNGANGGDVSFGVYLARGGSGGTTAGASGAGGGTGGSASKGAGNPGTVGTSGGAEAPTHFGGGSGGGAGNTTGAAGAAGGGAGPYTGAAGGSSASSQAGGGGGASTIYGQGGIGANGGATGSSATSTNYGSGGGGGGGNASNSAGGSGAPGYVLVQWVS